MKLATFVSRNGPAVGIVDMAGNRILDLAEAQRISASAPDPAFADMLALIDDGAPALARAAALAAQWPAAASQRLAGTKLMSPLPEPRQFRDSMVFELHVQNARLQAEKRTGAERPPIAEVWYRQPIYYKGNRFSFAGHEADVVWPHYSKVMDFELELACVIGTKGRDIEKGAAMRHIFGFAIFNDFSARDAQQAEMEGRLGPAKGKDFDGGNVLGPWIVTADEIGDPHNLKMDARVNGERWGGGTSATMHHKWPDILAHISMAETLHPGEVIGSGTVGTGCGMEHGRQLAAGDVVELEIEKIGILRNRVLRA